MLGGPGMERGVVLFGELRQRRQREFCSGKVVSVGRSRYEALRYHNPYSIEVFDSFLGGCCHFGWVMMNWSLSVVLSYVCWSRRALSQFIGKAHGLAR